MGSVVLLRHGETAWSLSRQHTGSTDIPLTPTGEEQARAAAGRLSGRAFALALTSPLRRAADTAALAGVTTVEPEPDLVEWDYGAYEGVTTRRIHDKRPQWDLWRDGVPDGETADDVGRRADRVLDRVRAIVTPDGPGDAIVFGHGHMLRVLAARWLGLAPQLGALLALDTATVSELGFEHGRPVVLSWNVAAAP